MSTLTALSQAQAQSMLKTLELLIDSCLEAHTPEAQARWLDTAQEYLTYLGEGTRGHLQLEAALERLNSLIAHIQEHQP